MGNGYAGLVPCVTSGESSLPSLECAVVLPRVAALEIALWDVRSWAVRDGGLSTIVSSWLISSASNGCYGTRGLLLRYYYE